MLKNKISYIVLIVIIGVFSILYNVYFTGILFLATIILPLALLLLTLYNKRCLFTELESSTLTLGKDDVMDVSVRVSNKSWFPISLIKLKLVYYNEFLHQDREETFQVSIDRKSYQTIFCKVGSHYSGVVVLNITSLCIYDYFLLWSSKKKINKSIAINITPKYYRLPIDFKQDNRNLYMISSYGATFDSGDDISEVLRFREYQEGDKPNLIHWKLSKKHNKLMVKEFSAPVKDSIAIVIHLVCGQTNEKFHSYVDGLLETAFSISCTCMENNLCHTLFWYNSKNENCQEMNIHTDYDFHCAIMEVLNSKVTYVKEPMLNDFKYLQGMIPFTRIVYVTTEINQEDIITWSQYHPEARILLFYVCDIRMNPLKEEEKHHLRDVNIELFEIDVNSIKESIMSISLD